MPVQVEDVLSVNAVLVGTELLNDANEVAACSNAIGQEFLQDGTFLDAVPQTAPIPGRVLRLPRERIFVQVSALRSRVTREYPAESDDVALVAKVATQALACASTRQPEVSAHGYNLTMVYSGDSGENALLYLGRRVFASPKFAPQEWRSLGGQGKLIFQDGKRQWTLTFEPRLQDPSTPKVFLDVNLHVPEVGVPGEDEMEARLRELWDRAHSLIEAIDANAHS